MNIVMCYASVTSLLETPWLICRVNLNYGLAFQVLCQVEAHDIRVLLNIQLIETRSLGSSYILARLICFQYSPALLILINFILHLKCSAVFRIFDLSTPMSLVEIAHQSCVLIVIHNIETSMNCFMLTFLRYEELAPFFDGVNFILWHLV